MKKLIFLISIGLIVLAGCSKDESNEQITEATANLFWVYNLDGKSQAGETIAIEKLQSDQEITYNRGNDNSAHTHGNIPGKFEFSGTQNNGGTHGSATVTVNGPFGLTVLTLETECIMVEGNEAVYGGIATEVVNPFGGFQMGKYVYFKVIDNGQGNNADPDQYHGLIGTSSSSLCGLVPPSDTSAWPPTITCCGGLTFDLILEVSEPGSVKVNN